MFLNWKPSSHFSLCRLEGQGIMPVVALELAHTGPRDVFSSILSTGKCCALNRALCPSPTALCPLSPGGLPAFQPKLQRPSLLCNFLRKLSLKIIPFTLQSEFTRNQLPLVSKFLLGVILISNIFKCHTFNTVLPSSEGQALGQPQHSVSGRADRGINRQRI